MESGMTSQTDLSQLKAMAQEALDLGEKSRTRALTANQYYHKKQRSEEERQALRQRKQPDIVINRIRPAVNGTLGVLEQGQTDPKAWPRTPDDDNSADVATKTLRYIADSNEFDSIRIQQARNYLIQTACAVLVGIDDNRRVKIEEIQPEEFLFDPRSRKEDFTDARYLGIAKWMYADAVAAMYPKAKDGIESALEAGPTIPVDPSLEDRPSGGVWVDRRNRRLLIIELYYSTGGRWMRAVFHSGGVIEAGESVYCDKDRKPTCPIIAQSCYIDDEGVRYGVVYDMLDPQDEINKRRSKALHLISTRQARVAAGSGLDVSEARAELAKPDGVIIGEPGDVEILPTGDMAQANLAMLQEAKAEMERTGPNPAMLGRQGADTSGRALLARNQAGMIELAVVLSGHRRWERRVYQQSWCNARTHWTAPDYIRVTDDEGAPNFVPINKPIHGPAQVVMGPDGMATLRPSVLGYENALAEMDVDIKLDSVPDTANLQQEQFQTLTELAKLYGPQEVPFDDMLMLSSITDKQKLMDRRKARQEQASQGQQPLQQLQMQDAVSKIEKTNSETQKNYATIAQMQADTTINALQAGHRSAGTTAAGF